MELLQPSKLIRVSPNRLTTFKDCAKKADFTYRLELAPIRTESKGHFDKGNYFHELSHVYYQLIKAGSKPGSDYAWQSLSSRIQNDLSLVKDPKIKLKLLPIYSIISRVMHRFVSQQSPIIDQRIEVLGIEHELEFVVNETYSLFGYSDLIYRDSSGRIRIRDHKSGEKAWSKANAENLEQLIFYACIWYKLTGEVPMGEISYINTKEYAKKIATFEEAFAFHSVNFTKKELDIYFSDICTKIEAMLKYPSVPSYSPSCEYCQFKLPCFAQRKGIDPEPVIRQHFKRVPRESARHVKFTEEYSTSDTSN